MCLSGNLKRQISRIKIFATLIYLVIPVSVLATEEHPECFPLESSWDNIEFLELPVSDAVTPIIGSNRRLGITFHKTHATVPRFYGFTYLELDTQNIPEIDDPYTLEKHFRNVKLNPLHEEIITEERRDHSYRFTPQSQGTWVIFLVAGLNRIPFLEQQGLRIYPNIEMKRGGTVFGGSSLNLASRIDYKACVVSMNQ